MNRCEVGELNIRGFKNFLENSGEMDIWKIQRIIELYENIEFIMLYSSEFFINNKEYKNANAEERKQIIYERIEKRVKANKRLIYCIGVKLEWHTELIFIGESFYIIRDDNHFTDLVSNYLPATYYATPGDYITRNIKKENFELMDIHEMRRELRKLGLIKIEDDEL